MINAVVVNARCRHRRQDFGIRFEEKAPQLWVGDWAFAVKESLARKEGYSQTISGTFDFDAEYPGCPYCHGMSLLVCSCGKVFCWDTVGSSATCPWCQNSGTISGTAGHLGGQGQY